MEFSSELERKIMRKTARMFTLALGSVLATSLLVPTVIGQASHQQPKSDSQMQKSAQTVTIDGKVSAVSENSVTVVDSKKAENTITIDTNTKITKGGKAATAADIKADDSITVVASKGEGGALTAVSIKVG